MNEIHEHVEVWACISIGEDSDSLHIGATGVSRQILKCVYEPSHANPHLNYTTAERCRCEQARGSTVMQSASKCIISPLLAAMHYDARTACVFYHHDIL